VHAQARAVDLGDVHGMQPDRVRAVRRARAEDAGERVGGVAARVDLLDLPVGARRWSDRTEEVARPAVAVTPSPGS